MCACVCICKRFMFYVQFMHAAAIIHRLALETIIKLVIWNCIEHILLCRFCLFVGARKMFIVCVVE